MLLGVSTCVAASPPQAGSASGQAIRTWNEIGSAQPAGNLLQHARILAIMHAAEHDAVNGAVPRYATPRSGDGFTTSDPFTPTPDPGVWEPTPPALAPMLEPQFPHVTPFALRDLTQVRPAPPPALTSPTYTQHFDEVKRFGQDTSSARTADQTHLGHFWVEPSPVGWSRVGNIVSAGRGYDLHETARLQALLTMAMADGFIASWDQKRRFAFWRPVTAIRLADTDGNPSTTADTGWTPLRATPSAPDYPSGHSVLGGAAAEVLRGVTGSDQFRFCMTSTTAEPAGTQRCWETFTQAERENAESRVMMGFHFRFACDTGVEVGRQVGRFTISHALRPLLLDKPGS